MVIRVPRSYAIGAMAWHHRLVLRIGLFVCYCGYDLWLQLPVQSFREWPHPVPSIWVRILTKASATLRHLGGWITRQIPQAIAVEHTVDLPPAEPPVPNADGEIRLIVMCQNEIDRLPLMFAHYRSIGVDRFFIIDNKSSDETRSWVAKQADAHLLAADGDFAKADSGAAWTRHVLEHYGQGHWCVVADADELLMFPGSETRSLHDLANYMEQEQSNVLLCSLLDIYPKGPITNGELATEETLTSGRYFFDPGHLWSPIHANHFAANGGVRRRAFGCLPCVVKTTFFKYETGMLLTHGLHGIWPARFSAIRGATIHLKFDSYTPPARQPLMTDFSPLGNAPLAMYNFIEGTAYWKSMQDNPQLEFWTTESIPFTGTAGLIENRVVIDTEDF